MKRKPTRCLETKSQWILLRRVGIFLVLRPSQLLRTVRIRVTQWLRCWSRARAREQSWKQAPWTEARPTRWIWFQMKHTPTNPWTWEIASCTTWSNSSDRPITASFQELTSQTPRSSGGSATSPKTTRDFSRTLLICLTILMPSLLLSHIAIMKFQNQTSAAEAPPAKTFKLRWTETTHSTKAWTQFKWPMLTARMAHRLTKRRRETVTTVEQLSKARLILLTVMPTTQHQNRVWKMSRPRLSSWTAAKIPSLLRLKTWNKGRHSQEDNGCLKALKSSSNDPWWTTWSVEPTRCCRLFQCRRTHPTKYQTPSLCRTPNWSWRIRSTTA